MDNYVFNESEYIHIDTVFEDPGEEANISVSSDGLTAKQKKFNARSFVQAKYLMKNNLNGIKKFRYDLDIVGDNVKWHDN